VHSQEHHSKEHHRRRVHVVVVQGSNRGHTFWFACTKVDVRNRSSTKGLGHKGRLGDHKSARRSRCHDCSQEQPSARQELGMQAFAHKRVSVVQQMPRFAEPMQLSPNLGQAIVRWQRKEG